ncbi:hypothetical protein T440DRAFT_522324 [Plenodomus tracheiphilus IPT5]|uniref:Uncharacterized protein n=1 Tax=Plenodomus tracheiphilus IPT5 TaxID=1408161 RepID=A0A6A7AUD8_9PLEO|nr:hypothetical protein T440DRAFT_522324 [Plenodomus tracheiphilus IPT5]
MYESLIEFKKLSGTYVSESLSNGTCVETASHEICLEERPERIYHLLALSNSGDGKIRLPPGLDYLNSPDGFHGLYKSDVVRAVLCKEEIVRPFQDSDDSKTSDQTKSPSDPATKLPERGEHREFNAESDNDLSNLLTRVERTAKVTERLVDYGNAPDAFTLPLVRSWDGGTLSSVEKDKSHIRGPCLSDQPDPELRSSWSNPNELTWAYTKRFIQETEFWKLENFGKICLDGDSNDCDNECPTWNVTCGSEETWTEILRLPADANPRSDKAWRRCKKN